MGNTEGGTGVTESELQALFDQVIELVAEHGHLAMQVDDPDGRTGFTYSIGFPVSAGHPEVLVFGQPDWVRQSMIQALYARVSQENLRLVDGARISNLIEGFDCIAREIFDPVAIHNHLCTAVGYHRSQHGTEINRAFQIVWPDPVSGLYPWDADCPQHVIDDQPALYTVSLNS